MSTINRGNVAQRTLSQSEIDQITQPGIGTSILNTALSGLGTLGTVLDTPGAFTRTLLQEGVGDAFSSIFNLEDRVSGSELVGEDSDEFTFKGLGAEILLDPLNFVTFGASTAAGKLAKSASKLGDAKLAQEALSELGKQTTKNRLAQTNKRLGDLASEAGTTVDNLPSLEKGLGNQVKAGQRSIVSVGLPFAKAENRLDFGAGSSLVNKLRAASKAGTPEAVQKKLSDLGHGIESRFRRSAKDSQLEALRIEKRILDRESRQASLLSEKKLRKRLKSIEKRHGEDVAQQFRQAIELEPVPAAQEAIIQAGKKAKRDLDNPLHNTKEDILKAGDRVDITVDEHKQIVADHLAAGKNVHEEVLNSYPDLKQQFPDSTLDEITEKEINQAIDRKIKAIEQLDNIPQEVKDASAEYIEANKERVLQEQAFGVPVDELPREIGYFARRLKPEFAEKFQSDEFKSAFKQAVDELNITTKLSFQQARTFPNIPLDEVNKRLAARFGDPENTRYFDDDVIRVQIRRELEGDLAGNRATFVSAVGRLFGDSSEAISKRGGKPVGLEQLFSDIDSVKPGALVSSTKLPIRRAFFETLQQDPAARELGETTRIIGNDILDLPGDASRKQIKKLLEDKNVVTKNIDKEILEQTARILQIAENPASLGGLFRVMDKVHGVYRGALTSLFPAFHGRNLNSGIFMNTLAGVHNPRFYADGIAELRRIRNQPDEVIRYAGLGVINEGKISETYRLMGTTDDPILKGAQLTSRAGRGFRKALDPGLAAGQGVENFNRMAHFLAKKADGLTDVEAAESVLKFHFDYSDLTTFERQYPRRLMLFYTFFRNNLPLMLEQAAKKPAFFAHFSRATGQTNPELEQNEFSRGGFFIPPFLQGMFFDEVEKGNQFRLNFGLPPEDLARFDPRGDGLGRVFEILIASSVPAISIPYEVISGQSTFTGQPVEGSTLERTIENSPVSRFAGVGGRLAEAFGGERDLTSELTRSLTGIAPRQFDPEDIQRNENIRGLKSKLEELVRTGDARKFEIIGRRRGQEEDPRIELLNRALGQQFSR